jgi:hypothetical protein
VRQGRTPEKRGSAKIKDSMMCVVVLFTNTNNKKQ